MRTKPNLSRLSCLWSPRYRNALALGMTVSFMACPSNTAAQEAADSTATDLKEVVVEAAMQSASAEKVIYRPTSFVKNAAQDAIDLLQRMSIPQISVSPIDKSVTTTNGQQVGIFINSLPASQEDINGIRTSDVKRVEYLDFPSDPKFRGVEHAINIIVQKYEFGGYTKISDRHFFLDDFSNFATIFSKFSYKKMVYDLYVAADNVATDHVGNSSTSSFNLPSGKIVRTKDMLSSDFKYVTIPVTFRAIYSSDKIQLANTFGFKFNDRFKSYDEGG